MSSLLGDIESVFGAVAKAFENVGSTISNIPSSVTNFFGQLGAAIYGAFTAFGTLLKKAWDNFVDAINSIGKWFYDAFKDISNFFKNLWSDLVHFLTWLGRELWDALQKFFRWVVETFNAISNFIVSHLNQAFGSIDAALYGMWCNFRNKIYDIVMANVTEVMVYKSIESAAEGKIPLRGLKDWASLAIRMMGAPLLGYGAAAVINSVLPGCTPKTKSLIGQFVMPSLTVSSAVTPAPVTTTTGVGSQQLSRPLTVSYSFTYNVGQLPSVSESYTVKYLLTLQTNLLTVYQPFRLSATVSLGVYASVAIQGLPSISGTTSLGTSVTYTVYFGVPASGSASLGTSLSYSVVAGSSGASTEPLGVSIAYSVLAPQYVSGSVSLGVSLSYTTYFGTPVQGSVSLSTSATYSLSASGSASDSPSLGSSVTYSVAEPGAASGTSELSVSVTYSIVESGSPSGSVSLGVTVSYTVGGYTSASGTSELSVSVTYSTAAPASTSASTSLSVSLSYSTASSVSSSNTLTQNISVSYSITTPVSSSITLTQDVSVSYSVIGSASASGSSELSVTVSYSTAAPVGLLSSSGTLNTSVTYSVANPPPAQATSASVAVGVSGQAVDPATAALSLPTPNAVSYLYSIGPTPAAQALMSIVARGSPSPAYGLIQGLISSYGADYVQSVLYAAANLYYFSPMITLFTFNQPAVSSGSVYSGFNPPLFASSITGNFQTYACIRCTPVVVANSVAISNYIAYDFNNGGTGASPGCNDGGPGAQGIVLITNSIITPATLTASGFANVSPCSGSMSGAANASISYYDSSAISVPLSVYLNYAGGYWWLSPYTPPSSGKGTCCFGGCSYIGAGGGGAAGYNCNYGYGGWYFETSPGGSQGTCLISPGNYTVVATPYLMFTNPQSMAVVLMQAVSDLWLMYVLNVTPSSIAPMPVVGGGAGGGGSDTGAGGGAGSAGEVIVLAYNYQPLTINANGGNALCGSAANGGGGGAGGYVVVMYPSTSSAPSVSASVNGGSPCTANSQGCVGVSSAGSPGVSLVTPVSWSAPPYITPVTVSFT